MTDETVFEKAVDEFYKKLFTMTDSLVVVLQRAESPVVHLCALFGLYPEQVDVWPLAIAPQPQAAASRIHVDLELVHSVFSIRLFHFDKNASLLFCFVGIDDYIRLFLGFSRADIYRYLNLDLVKS